EVRALAKRSADAAKQISGLIGQSVAQIAEGSRNAEKSGTVIDGIVHGVQQTSGLIAEISAASGEQAGGVEEINRSIAQLEGVTQQNAALVEEAAASAMAFDDEARRLADLVARFRIAGEAAAAVVAAAPVRAPSPASAPALSVRRTRRELSRPAG